MTILLIVIGAAIGAPLRYLTDRFVQSRHDSVFPWGTLTVNVTGCLAIGLLAAAFSGSAIVREDLRLFLFVGVLGGYTTFSAFGRETIEMLHANRYAPAAAYVLLSNALGLAAVWFGHAILRK